MRLPSILEPPLFAQAELDSLRLDGDAIRVGDALVPIDHPVDAAVRAASLKSALPSRAHVLELQTAAWVHGAVEILRSPYRLAVDRTAARTVRMPGGHREVVYLGGDIEELGGVRVTSAFRTASDLLRLDELFGDHERTTVLTLLQLTGLPPRVVVSRFDSLPATAFKRRGRKRLEELAAE